MHNGGGPQELHLSSWSAKLSLLGLGWLVTLSLAVYTGEAAAMFTRYEREGELSDLNAAIAKGKILCCSRATSRTMVSLYPSARFALDESDGRAGLLSRRDIFRCVWGSTRIAPWHRPLGCMLHDRAHDTHAH